MNKACPKVVSLGRCVGAPSTLRKKHGRLGGIACNPACKSSETVPLGEGGPRVSGVIRNAHAAHGGINHFPRRIFSAF